MSRRSLTSNRAVFKDNTQYRDFIPTSSVKMTSQLPRKTRRNEQKRNINASITCVFLDRSINRNTPDTSHRPSLHFLPVHLSHQLTCLQLSSPRESPSLLLMSKSNIAHDCVVQAEDWNRRTLPTFNKLCALASITGQTVIFAVCPRRIEIRNGKHAVFNPTVEREAADTSPAQPFRDATILLNRYRATRARARGS